MDDNAQFKIAKDAMVCYFFVACRLLVSGAKEYSLAIAKDEKREGTGE